MLKVKTDKLADPHSLITVFPYDASWEIKGKKEAADRSQMMRKLCFYRMHVA